MKRLESEKTLFFVEIGWRDVSFGVMVSVIELRHVSSRNGRSILSEQKVRNPAWNEAKKKTSAAGSRISDGGLRHA